MESRGTKRRLAAILATDMVGFSRLVEMDEEGTLARQKAHRADLIDPRIAAHGGRIVKSTGDGLLVEFASAVDAVRCAVEVQRAVAEREAGEPEDRRIAYRVGINLGDIVIDGDDILGDGVNVAARLEGLAEPGGVCVSDMIFRSVKGKLDLGYADLGPQKVKNITEPVHAYRIEIDSARSPSTAAERPLELPDKPSIAVLPFADMSAEKDQEYFADGITEDIITDLSRKRNFFVIARNSTFTYKGKAVDVKRVSRELGVRYVLEGSIRKSGKRVRITAQLVNAETGNHVWAERYDRDLEDIFALQDEITQSIVAAVDPEFMLAEMQRALRKDVRNLDALDYRLRAGWHMFRFTKKDNAEARRLALRAVDLDPGNAEAFFVLATTHFYDGSYGWSRSPVRSLSEARDAAERAVALDARDARSHHILGLVGLYSRRHDESIRKFETAIDLDPNYAGAMADLGQALAWSGESERVAAEINRAMRLSPRDLRKAGWIAWLGFADFAAERYEDAAEWARKAVQENPKLPQGHILLAASCGQLGRIDEARAALAERLRASPGLTVDAVRSRLPWKHHADMERFLDGLRKAGLPE